MRAILLAAGFGTRLKPLTDTVPKCLVPINGQPLLDIWLQSLLGAHVKSFLINTHYLSKQVEEYINSTNYRDNSLLVHESELLGTAGTLLTNINFYEGEDGMLIHADNYCLANMAEFIDAHQNRPKHCLMTMMTFRTESPESCGIVELDDNNVVVGFHEKVQFPPGNLANGAVYILSKELLLLMQTEFNTAFEFSIDVLPCLKGKIYAYETKDIFLDIGTPENYKIANQLNKNLINKI